MAVAAERQRSIRVLVDGGDPDEPYPVPTDDTFDDPFLPADDLDRIAQGLIRTHAMTHLYSLTVRYLWKAKGGEGGGTLTLGKCQKLSGLNKYLSEGDDFVIWLAADHCREKQFTRWHVEALLFHELNHIQIDADSLKPIAAAHDVEEFRRVIEVYGFWKDDLKAAAHSFSQAPLFDEPRDRSDLPMELLRTVRDLAPLRGDGLSSITVSATGHEPITFTAADRERLDVALGDRADG